MIIKAVTVENKKLTSLTLPMNHSLSTIYKPGIKTKKNIPVFVYEIPDNDESTLLIIQNFTRFILSTWVIDYPERNTFELWKCSANRLKPIKFSIIPTLYLIKDTKVLFNKNQIINYINSDGDDPDIKEFFALTGNGGEGRLSLSSRIAYGLQLNKHILTDTVNTDSIYLRLS